MLFWSYRGRRVAQMLDSSEDARALDMSNNFSDDVDDDDVVVGAINLSSGSGDSGFLLYFYRLGNKEEQQLISQLHFMYNVDYTVGMIFFKNNKSSKKSDH
jgi:hypothetical protein